MSELCYLCLAAPAVKQAPGYGFDVCAQCWNNAAQGWPEQFEPAVRQALARAGLLIPDRNQRRRYPRSYAPPADHAL